MDFIKDALSFIKEITNFPVYPIYPMIKDNKELQEYLKTLNDFLLEINKETHHYITTKILNADKLFFNELISFFNQVTQYVGGYFGQVAEELSAFVNTTRVMVEEIHKK